MTKSEKELKIERAAAARVEEEKIEAQRIEALRVETERIADEKQKMQREAIYDTVVSDDRQDGTKTAELKSLLCNGLYTIEELLSILSVKREIIANMLSALNRSLEKKDRYARRVIFGQWRYSKLTDNRPDCMTRGSKICNILHNGVNYDLLNDDLPDTLKKLTNQ